MNTSVDRGLGTVWGNMSPTEKYHRAVARKHQVVALKLAVAHREELEAAGVTPQDLISNLEDRTGQGSYSHGAINNVIAAVKAGWKIPKEWVDRAFFTERRFQNGTSILQLLRLHKIAPHLVTREDLEHPITRDHIVCWAAMPDEFQPEAEKKAIEGYKKIGLGPTPDEITIHVVSNS